MEQNELETPSMKHQIIDKTAAFVRERVLAVALGKGGKDIEKNDIIGVLKGELLMITFEAGTRTDMMKVDLLDAEETGFIEIARTDDEGNFVNPITGDTNMTMFTLTESGINEVFPAVKQDLRASLMRLVELVDALQV